MTVKELIEFLQGCPPDSRVMVKSYELGIKDLEPKYCSMTYAVLNEWYGSYGMGPHEQHDSPTLAQWEKEACGGPLPEVIPIVLLDRS
jgi:hypothetical protein